MSVDPLTEARDALKHIRDHTKDGLAEAWAKAALARLDARPTAIRMDSWPRAGDPGCWIYVDPPEAKP